MAKPPFAVGDKVVSKIKATYGKEREVTLTQVSKHSQMDTVERRRQKVYATGPQPGPRTTEAVTGWRLNIHRRSLSEAIALLGPRALWLVHPSRCFSRSE